MSEKSRLIIVAVIAVLIGLIFGHFNVPSRWIVDEPQTKSGVTGPATVEVAWLDRAATRTEEQPILAMLALTPR